MTNQYFPTDPRDYLKFELSQRQQRRPQYSLRAFARDLEVSPSALCEFLNGRHGLSYDRVQEIAPKLRLSDEQRAHLWDLVESKFAREAGERRAAKVRAERRAKESKQRLPLENYRLVADWYHFAILEMTGVKQGLPSASELADIFGVPTAEMNQALKRLEKLELIKANSDGVWVASDEVTVAGGQEADQAVRLGHQQCLRYHSEQVDLRSMDSRESLSISFKVAQKDWHEMRRAMRDAIISVATRFSDDKAEPDQVVSMCMQMVTLLPVAESQREIKDLRAEKTILEEVNL